jgi:hypothetical protein
VGTCGPIVRIAILGHFEYEYRDAEYEYEKKQNNELQPSARSSVFALWKVSSSHSVTASRSMDAFGT